MLPNSVQFAKHLVDLAAPVLQGQTTITEANIKAERRNMQHSKYVMEVTFDNNLKIINIDKGLKVYDSQNSKSITELNTGDAVFLNTVSIGTTALEVAFNSNNKFIIQENITDTFKAELVEQVNANKVDFVVYAVNHAGGKKAIGYTQGINAKAVIYMTSLILL